MTIFMNLWRMIAHPRQTTGAILENPKRLRDAAIVVLGFSVVLALLCFKSHLAGDYPPPADALETWGEFAMMPFVKVPPQQYRLAQALFVTPMILAAWILMAGSAKLLSIVFGGRVTFEQYLAMFAYSFFAFWILASLSDILYEIVLGELVAPALRAEYGAVAKWLVAMYPPTMWTVLLGVGGIYNGIVVRESERFGPGKCVIIAVATFVWPVTLITLLIR